MRSALTGTLVLALLSGCTSTPSSGPTFRDIESGASLKVSSKDSVNKVVGVDYALIDLDQRVLNYFEEKGVTSLAGGFGGGRGSAPGIPLGAGDVVQVAIFESQAGGLFIPSDAGSRPGNFITLPEQTIDRNGQINVPYAGRIKVAGRSVDQVQSEIQDALANRAIEPQVVVTKVRNRSAQVAVVGDVNTPAKFELTEAGDRVLDAISQAGGLNAPGVETYITLQRGGRSATILYDHLINTPAENIYLAPNDTLIVNRERRTFIALGASGINGRLDFEDANLTLGEAMGKAGGLLDGRANPSQVLVYREVDRKSLSGLGIDTAKFRGDSVPVIFRANVRDPSGFFAMQKFPMQDKDILYTTNSDSVELLKFLNVVNSVSTTVSGVPIDAANAKDAVRSF
ncbi:sugar ABC transporter substrate-binding protein [Agrobacterium tumefaciens]|uniref:Sugar ABC transporter substrate-binding protein n=1 Tax=Agrobacterium tumefaciens TaxID=358 RepID=A0A0D0KFQ2_AGRTU|nr:polysaccharide biosynthesis/export family protein [Rhizobium skierniewicense]KIP98149.1 sugar ABC transporter substrate-binding protein [Agrobacterium tumefaciens]MCI9868142.1 polysaccharide export protein [Rhizobium skierniewicense]